MGWPRSIARSIAVKSTDRAMGPWSYRLAAAIRSKMSWPEVAPTPICGAVAAGVGAGGWADGAGVGAWVGTVSSPPAWARMAAMSWANAVS